MGRCKQKKADLIRSLHSNQSFHWKNAVFAYRGECFIRLCVFGMEILQFIQDKVEFTEIRVSLTPSKINLPSNFDFYHFKSVLTTNYHKDSAGNKKFVVRHPLYTLTLTGNFYANFWCNKFALYSLTSQGKLESILNSYLKTYNSEIQIDWKTPKLLFVQGRLGVDPTDFERLTKSRKLQELEEILSAHQFEINAEKGSTRKTHQISDWKTSFTLQSNLGNRNYTFSGPTLFELEDMLRRFGSIQECLAKVGKDNIFY